MALRCFTLAFLNIMFSSFCAVTTPLVVCGLLFRQLFQDLAIDEAFDVIISVAYQFQTDEGCSSLCCRNSLSRFQHCRQSTHCSTELSSGQGFIARGVWEGFTQFTDEQKQQRVSYVRHGWFCSRNPLKWLESDEVRGELYRLS